MTLILVAILALAVVELLVFLKPRLEFSHQLLRRTVLGSAAATGIDCASAVLMEDLNKDSGIDFLEEAWTREIDYQLDGILVTVQIKDEERKFPISYIASNAGLLEEQGVQDPPGLVAFRELLTQSGISSEQWKDEACDSLADWIDANDRPRSQGAEDDYYGIFGYQPRNALPMTLGELKYVKGFCDGKSERTEVTKVVFPFLSTFSKQINLNTASPEVLESMLESVFGSGPGSDISSLILSKRRIKPIDNGELAQILPRGYTKLIYGHFTVKSSFFSVWSTAVDESGRQESVYAVLKRDEKKNRVIYWNQISSGSQPLPGRE